MRDISKMRVYVKRLRPLFHTQKRWLSNGTLLKETPSLRDFMPSSVDISRQAKASDSFWEDTESQSARTFYMESYGCQMNMADSEIIESILTKKGFSRVDSSEKADAVLLNTCSIREKAEDRIWARLNELKSQKTKLKLPHQSIAVLGCMAERLKSSLLEKKKLVDVVVGPDAYRDLPRLLYNSFDGEKGVNVRLSLEETYADIAPVRSSGNGVTSFVSIMRGCNNMCSYCIVPFTRGRERSRDVSSIVSEVQELYGIGFREVTLLGQNVNSYNYVKERSKEGDRVRLADGFSSITKLPVAGVSFANLLDQVALAVPEMRIRFVSPHPKDFPDEVLDVIASRHNICNQIHIPAQSGSSSVLERMRRGYTNESYRELIRKIGYRIPGVSLSSDFITGFCGETDEEHSDTLQLLEDIHYDQAFLYAYSDRGSTHASRTMEDDVPVHVKKSRLAEIIEIFNRNARAKAQNDIGTVQLVLVEGNSRRDENSVVGRNDGNKRVVFPKESVPSSFSNDKQVPKPGDFVAVRVTEANQQTLQGIPMMRTTLGEFASMTLE